MKKIITSLFVLRLRAVLATTLLLLPLASKAQFSGSGSGTENDPYLIFNAIQLDQVRNFLSKSVYFKLMADIDLTDWIADNSPSQGWLPIGNKSSAFNGTFDGNGHKITGMTINRPSTDYVGLFGYVGNTNGTIKNVSVAGDITAKDKVGLLVGYCGGGSTNIYGCNVSGKIKGNSYIGGVIGYYDYNSKNSSVYNNISVVNIQAGNDYAGGIVGYDYYADINGNAVIGHIKSNGSYVGGVCGSSYNNDFSDNYFIGSVSGKIYVGGLSGCISNTTIERNYSKASIVEGTDVVGGIVGSCKLSSKINSNVSLNENIVASGSNVGRIYGHIDLYNSSVGDIGTASTNRALLTTKINSIDVDLEDSKQNGQNTGLSTLKNKATYQGIGWDFDNTWNIQDTESFPYLAWQTAPPVIESVPVTGGTEISGKSVDGGTVEMYVGEKLYTTTCSGNNWTITTEPLQAGETVAVFAKAEDKRLSYPATVTVAYEGEGTEDNPYKITSVEDLRNVNGDGYYKIQNDLDLTAWIETNSPTSGWQPIDIAAGMKAHIDGDGHTISGLWINGTDDNAGLFSVINGGAVKNLTVNVTEGKQVKGGSYVGIIASQVKSGSITDSRVSGDVEGSSYVGGLLGYTESTNVSRCHSTGSVTATDTKASYAGGLVGVNGTSATVENCYSEASVTSVTYAAGLVGYNYGSVNNCYASGEINSTNTGAGVVGYNDGADAKVSGLVAVNKFINIESPSGIGMRVTGGLKNNAPAPGSDSYASGNMVLSKNGIPQTIYDDPLNGYKKTEEELTTKSLYETLGWDMSTTWGIDEGYSYPYLLIFNVPVTSVKFDYTEASIEQGQTLTLTATVSPDDARNKVLSWKTSDETVATVSSDGIVTAVKAGEATITATTTDGTELSASCKVTVTTKSVTSVSLDKEEIELEEGEAITLTATVLPEDAGNKELSWSSDDETVATVSKDGTVTAVKTGEATITATTTDGTELSASCKVTVTPKSVTSVSLDKEEIELEEGKTVTLTATVLPEDAGNKELSWSSSDETVATVSGDGTVTAVKEGEATITATTTDGTELSATCKVTVISSTGIDMTYKNSLNVSTADKKIIVSGADDGTLIKVYGINGQLLSSGANTVIPVSVSGVYIVEIEGLRYKIGVK